MRRLRLQVLVLAAAVVFALTSTVAAAQEPGLYSSVITRGGLTSLREAFDRPIKYLDAPEIFCLDLYKEFDLDSIRTLGSR